MARLKTKYLTEGPVDERVEVVLLALKDGEYTLRQDPKKGAYLISVDDDTRYVLPVDVMERMVELELIEFFPAH